MAVRIVVAHAPWAEGREASLRRMLEQLDGTEVVVFSSPKREHAFVWAQRIWRWCAYQDKEADAETTAANLAGRAGQLDDWLILNDDVATHPQILAAAEACLEAVGRERVLCFHTNALIAPELARIGQRWLESYWVTGPAYLLPHGMAERLVAWCEFQGAAVWAGNEDSAAMEWMWSERLPAWHSIPALVQHDVTVPSTLGYDGHPMRQSLVPWTTEDVTSPYFWRASSAIHIECPWMSETTLADRESTRAVMGHSGKLAIGGDE